MNFLVQLIIFLSLCFVVSQFMSSIKIGLSRVDFTLFGKLATSFKKQRERLQYIRRQCERIAFEIEQSFKHLIPFEIGWY